MISYEEIREKLQTCENPLIFFDDDADGVCSFLLIYKYLNKGHGVIVKSTPEIKADPYIRKITEYMPDLVIILDKPKVEDEFLKGISCDVIWIDHHEPQTITQKNVYYYNPEVEGKQKPTTAICYEIVNQNSWIAMTGTTGDWHYDKKIAKDFQKDFPDYIDAKLTKAPDILFTTKIGELVKIIAFNLKGKITEVKKSIKVFTRIESPDEILDKKTPAGTFIYKKYKKMNVLYEELKKEVLAQKNETLFLEHISTNQQVSFSSELSNEILYLCPEKVIIIGRTSGGNTKGSVRTALDIDLRPAIEESTQGIGYGGGHDKACGFCVEDEHFHIFLEKFKAKIEEIVEEK